MGVSLVSLNAMANVRANDMFSQATPATVGHRPVVANEAKKLTVTGDLTTGSTLTITDFNFTDDDGDKLSINKMVASTDKIKWYIVDNDAAVPTGNPQGEGTTFTIPADAGGKKIKVVYRLMTETGTPDSAFLPATVLLTTSSSGVSGDSANDGTISNKLRSVAIKVINQSGKPTDEHNGTDVAGTPVVGGTLEAEIQCAASSAADCDVSKYDFAWEIADVSAPNQFASVTNNHTEPHKYTIKGTEQNKLFRVHVTPKTVKATQVKKPSNRS